MTGDIRCADGFEFVVVFDGRQELLADYDYGSSLRDFVDEGEGEWSREAVCKRARAKYTAKMRALKARTKQPE